jgi:hypothetical protein
MAHAQSGVSALADKGAPEVLTADRPSVELGVTKGAVIISVKAIEKRSFDRP